MLPISGAQLASLELHDFVQWWQQDDLWEFLASDGSSKPLRKVVARAAVDSDPVTDSCAALETFLRARPEVERVKVVVNEKQRTDCKANAYLNASVECGRLELLIF